MTVDARCLIATDLGIVKDGSGLSEDHAQGLGLITYRGTFIFNGILTPARGRVIQVAYARPQYGASGLLTRFYPRLQVISSSADPFANETTVEVGCQLELMRGRKDPVQYRAIDHPPAWWTALSTARRREVPPVIEVQGVIEFCLDALGIPLAAGSATTSDVKVVEAIDLSGGYVQALDDMLRSSLLIGHITPAGELLVQPVDLVPAAGPVLRRGNLLTLQPINDRGGAEQVVVEFDAIEAPQGFGSETKDLDDETNNQDRARRNWELDKTVAPPAEYSIPFTAGDGSQAVMTYGCSIVTETTTRYMTIQWTNSEGKTESQDVATFRSTVTTGCVAEANPAAGTSYLSNGFTFPGGQSDSTTTTTETSYITTSDGPRVAQEITSTYHSGWRFVGSLGVRDYVIDGVAVVPSSGQFLVSRQVVKSETNDQAGLTIRATTRYSAAGKKQSGGQGSAAGAGTIVNAADLVNILNAAIALVCEGTEVQSGIGRQFGMQTRPSGQALYAADRLSRNRRSSIAFINSGIIDSSAGQDDAQVVTGLYQFGGAGTDQWNTRTLQLPYAPDDFFFGENGTSGNTINLFITRGRARQRAIEYGRIQNALSFGHANGVEVTTAPWELPSPPLAAVYIEESGVSTAFRTNGRNWEIRNGAMIVTADLCLVGAAGRIIGETPVNWTPQPAAATALPGLGAPSGTGELLPANTITLPSGFNPAAPGTIWSSLPTNGADSYGPSRSPGSIAPPYVQTVKTLARSRAVVITTELLYSVVPITETITATSRAVAETTLQASTEDIVAVSRALAFTEEI